MVEKLKEVRSHTRKTKSGKTVIIRAHKARYDAAENQSVKKGAGKEFKEKKSNGAFPAWARKDATLEDALKGWDNMVDSMDDYGLLRGLSFGGFLDNEYEKEWPHLNKLVEGDAKKYMAKHSAGVRKELKDYLRSMATSPEGMNSDSYKESIKETIQQFPCRSRKQEKQLEALGLKKSGGTYVTPNHSYTLYTQAAIQNFLNKFGHLSPEEIAKLPRSKTMQQKYAGASASAKSEMFGEKWDKVFKELR